MLDLFQARYVQEVPNEPDATTTHIIRYRPSTMERILHSAGLFCATPEEAAEHWNPESYLMGIWPDELEHGYRGRGVHGNRPLFNNGYYRTVTERINIDLAPPLQEIRGDALTPRVTYLMNAARREGGGTTHDETSSGALLRRESLVLHPRQGHYALLFGSEGSRDVLQLQISCNLNTIREDIFDNGTLSQGARLTSRDASISTPIGRSNGSYVLVDLEPSCPAYNIRDHADWGEPLRGTITEIRAEDLHSTIENLLGRTIPRTYR